MQHLYSMWFKTRFVYDCNEMPKCQFIVQMIHHNFSAYKEFNNMRCDFLNNLSQNILERILVYEYISLCKLILLQHIKHLNRYN